VNADMNVTVLDVFDKITDRTSRPWWRPQSVTQARVTVLVHRANLYTKTITYWHILVRAASI